MKFVELARNAHKNGKLREAAAYWEVAALLRPNNNYVQRSLSIVKQNIQSQIEQAMIEADRSQADGKLELAESALLRIIMLDPEHVESGKKLRQLALMTNKLSQLAKLEKTRKFYLSPDGGAPATSPAIGSENPYQLGLELLQQGKVEAAIVEFKSRLQTHPRDSIAKRHLAQASLLLAEELDKDGNNEGALQNYTIARHHGALNRDVFQQRTKEIKTKLADQYYNKGLEIYREDLGKAVKYFEKALIYKPNHAAAALKLKQSQRMLNTIQQFSQN